LSLGIYIVAGFCYENGQPGFNQGDSNHIFSTFKRKRPPAMIETVATAARAVFRYIQSKNGQSLAEYALILSFISLLTVVIDSILGFQLRGIFLAILNALAAARTSI